MRILFVDDDEVTLFLYRRLAKNRGGLDAHYARNASEALDWINAAEYPFDVVFLDVNMPVMNGYEFLQQHNNLPADKKAKNIFLMLGTDISEDKQFAVAPMIKEFVNKPLRDDKFNALLASV